MPAYLADMLEFLPIQQRATMTRLVYSTFATFADYVRNLTTPCSIGMVSVSGSGMKTMDGVFAELIGKQHRLILFLLEWPVAKDRKIVIRKPTSANLPGDWASHLPIATEDDFKAVDVLFTDSITKNFVRHHQCINYDLLSQESLRAIAAVKVSNGA